MEQFNGVSSGNNTANNINNANNACSSGSGESSNINSGYSYNKEQLSEHVNNAQSNGVPDNNNQVQFTSANTQAQNYGNNPANTNMNYNNNNNFTAQNNMNNQYNNNAQHNPEMHNPAYNNNYNNSYPNGAPSNFSNNVNNFSTGGNNNNNSDRNSGRKNKPKKNSFWKKAVAAVLAVAVVGSASGFGGAYLAGSIISGNNNGTHTEITEPNENNNEDANDYANDYQNDNDQEEYEDADSSFADQSPDFSRQEESISNDLMNLENMAAISNTRLTAEELFTKVNKTIVVVNNYQYQSVSSYSDIFNFYDDFRFGGGNNNKNDNSDKTLVVYGTGSGIIITTDGYIVTNYHVIENAVKVTVSIDDNNDGENIEELEATVVGGDKSTDIAVLKIDAKRKLQAAALGDSSTLKVGQSVCAIGNPAGLTKTITGGMISGLNRHYAAEDGYELSSIQTDTAINPGNSGGGLFDMYGNVVGIVNAKIVSDYTESLGFAITINEAKPVISDLINHGYVTGRPVLGISTVALTEYTAYLYGFSTTGLLVSEINQEAPIAKSKLRVGDIIVAVNGKDVSEVSDVQSILKQFKAGDTVTLTVVRNNSETGRSSEIDIDVILTENTGE